MSNSNIFAWTQSILAFIVVIGSGVLMYYNVLSTEAATGVVGVILGYFFGSGVTPKPFTQRDKGI